MEHNDCSGSSLIALASSLAILIGNEFDTDDLDDDNSFLIMILKKTHHKGAF